MNKLEQMQEIAMEKFDTTFNDHIEHCVGTENEWYELAECKQHLKNLQNNLITEVWNEAIKECEKKLEDALDQTEQFDHDYAMSYVWRPALEGALQKLLPKPDITSDK